MIYIYSDLDSIYDTRYNLLELLLGKKLLNDITRNYNSRMNDDFKLIPEDIFKYYYRKRDLRVMYKPRPVMIQEYILSKILDLSQTSLSRGGDGQVTFLINTFPYLLHDSKKELFKSYFLKHLPKRTNVELITYEDIPYKKYDISEFVLYDGLEKIDKLIKKDKIKYGKFSDSLLVIPDNLIKNGPSFEDRDTILKQLEMIYKPFINIEFCSVSFFSYDKNTPT